MGFKTDLSFLQKLTLGAHAAQAAIAYLKQAGFMPIELERYSTSNKLWATKLKRLRLPDILCAWTGLRFEVRGKTDLQVSMSNSPTRRWDDNLRAEDLVALVKCQEEQDGDVSIPGIPTFFWVGDLRAAEATAQAGQRKSFSEGSEQASIWPSWVPSQSGEVLDVSEKQIKVRLSSGRTQTYPLRGRSPYVSAGEHFLAGADILAGTVRRVVKVHELLHRSWDPIADLTSGQPTDRYVAAKAIPCRTDIGEQGRALLEGTMKGESDPRVKLEMAGSLARMGIDSGYEELRTICHPQGGDTTDPLYMESILILSELATPRAADILEQVARAPEHAGQEARQAAVWGLGKKGTKTYGRLLPFLADPDEDVVLHAIAAFDADAPMDVIQQLVHKLVTEEEEEERQLAAISEALRLIGTSRVVQELVRVARTSQMNPWVVATLGRLPPIALGQVHIEPDLWQAIQPVRLLSESSNWLAAGQVATSFQLLLRQRL